MAAGWVCRVLTEAAEVELEQVVAAVERDCASHRRSMVLVGCESGTRWMICPQPIPSRRLKLVRQAPIAPID